MNKVPVVHVRTNVRYISRAELKELPHARWLDIALDSIYAQSGPADFQKSTWRP